MNERRLRWVVELSIFPLLALAIYVWGAGLDWEFDELRLIRVFPLLGLVAFTTMWWHFLVGFIKQIRPDFQKFKSLHTISGYWVFIAILLHPIILWTWGITSGAGSIFEATRNYTGSRSYKFALLGVFSLTIFLLFDLARWLRERPWVTRNWWLIDMVDDAAFLIIWIHSYNLGSHTQEGWFGWLWIFYGLSGLFFVVFKHLKTPAKLEESPI